jgi:hypothetical protein
MEPASVALIPPRWHISMVRFPVTFASGGRSIYCRISRMRPLGTRFKNGELNGERLFQRSVEDRIARRILELREKDRILAG